MFKIKIPIEVSGRHIHLSKKDGEKLFGHNYQLKMRNPLSQKGEFAAQETVTLKTKDGEIKNVCVAGPLRLKTQVEISRTDAINLKINPPLRHSGDLKGTPGLTVIGPKGQVNLKQGVIIILRHLHLSPKDASKFGLKNGQEISVKVAGKRGLIFNNIKVRVHPDFVFRIQIDTDEANAADIKEQGRGELLV